MNRTLVCNNDLRRKRALSKVASSYESVGKLTLGQVAQLVE
jgi:hypothetical protein